MSRLARVGKALGFRQVPRQGTMVISGCRVEGKSNSHPQVVSRCGGGQQAPYCLMSNLTVIYCNCTQLWKLFPQCCEAASKFYSFGGDFLDYRQQKKCVPVGWHTSCQRSRQWDRSLGAFPGLCCNLICWTCSDRGIIVPSAPWGRFSSGGVLLNKSMARAGC